MMKNGSILRWLTLSVVFMFMISTPVSAFQDLSAEDEAYERIMQLRETGVISGVDGEFQGDRLLTFAEGIQMLVRGMELNLDGYMFIKEPLASDYYDLVPGDAWYAESFITAAVLGLGIEREVDPHAVMTREQYAHYLMKALSLTGNYPFTKMFFVIKDQDEINPDYSHSIQLLLNGKIIRLDEESAFHPKREITRREAAVMLADAIDFKNRHQIIQSGEDPESDGTVSFEVTRVTEDVNKVTVSWGEQPHPGYGISVAGIEFSHEDMIATVYYKLSYPDPERMYPQVIVYPKAVTYIPSEYQVKITQKVADQHPEPDTDTESGTGSDRDTDTNTDTNTDTDAETDPPADTDTDSDTNSNHDES